VDLAKPEAIVGYTVRFAAAEAAKVFGFSELESIPCSGDACQDLDHRIEEIKAACRLTNTGRREIKVGVVMKGNREPTLSTSLAPTKTMPLNSFTR
jgi:hypothetical protein